MNESDAKPETITGIIETNRQTGEVRYVRPKDALPMPAVDLYHRMSLDSATYAQLAGVCDPALAPTGIDYLEHYLAAMEPRNSAERMLAVQMLWQHARLARLLRLWSHAANEDRRKALDTAIDAAMGVSRRQAATWAALKSPRPVQIIAGGQVNVAGQQVVSNANPAPGSDSRQSRNESNEQGSRDASPKALPAERERFDFPEGFGAGGEALEPVHGAADARG
jgi:hypothetical protein